MDVLYMKREGKPSLAYRIEKRGADVTVVFLTGFRSDIMGTKCNYIEGFCRNNGLNFLAFDYTGHGSSEGVFEECSVKTWFEDAMDFIGEMVPEEKVLLVGSSMGGWISLLVAEALGEEKVKGVVCLAAAPDFTDWIYDSDTKNIEKQFEERGYYELPNEFSDAPYKISRKLIEESRECFVMNRGIEFGFPLRIIQGMCDSEVPWDMAFYICNHIKGEDKKIHMLKDSNHRLSGEKDLLVICRVIGEVSGAGSCEAASRTIGVDANCEFFV